MVAVDQNYSASLFGRFAGLTCSINSGLPIASQIAVKMNWDRLSFFFLQWASTASLMGSGILKLIGLVSLIDIGFLLPLIGVELP